MGANRATFEVMKCREGRWTVETVCKTEEDARAYGKKIYADRKVEGIRIVRNWKRADGNTVENTIHEEVRQAGKDEPARIVPIEDSPVCQEPQEFYALEARMTINRLLRNYLEKVFLTPTELMHNYKELKRLQDGDIFPSAVDRVATLQAKVTGEDSKSRKDTIFKNIDAMAARAKRAEKYNLPSLREASLNDIIARVEQIAAPDERDYLILTTLARELIGTRNWLGKLQRLTQLSAEEGLRPDALALLDGVIADLIGAQMLQDLLGWQPSLASALCCMIDLTEGKMPVGDDAAPDDGTVILNRLFGAGVLPGSKQALFDRVVRHIKAAQPLNRNDPSKESEGFRLVALRLMTPRGLIGGPDTAEALTVRFTRMVEQGGATGRRAAIQGVVTNLADPLMRVLYLIDLSQSALAEEHKADILQHLLGICSAPSLDNLIPRTVPPKERMSRATVIYNTLQASPLPQNVRNDLCDRVDEMLARYLVEEGIIEKLDHKDSSLRERSTWLVQFCAAQILPNGKALKLARDRVINLLRQANFDARFVEGITDPTAAQKALRDFHQLLVKAGFGG